jgi:PAS domain-containing protein
MVGVAEPDAAVLESWLEALFVTSSAAMAVISTFEGRYLRANDAFVELLGLAREELFSADLDAILDASERASTLTAQILAHGRRESVVPRVFSLSEAVEPLRRMFARTIGSKRATRCRTAVASGFRPATST